MRSCPSDDTFTDFIEGRLTGKALSSFYEHASTCQACATTLAELSRSTVPSHGPSHRPSEAGELTSSTAGLMQEWIARPAVVGRYRPTAVLGAGGMGIVYLARDTQLNRNVALKITRAGVTRAGTRRLLREAQAMAQLSHRNVVTVHDVGMWREHVFVAMEYLEGGTLARYLLDHPQPWHVILEKFRQAGEGLAAAHRAAIVHRDFKPENVLLSATGEVRVADFGLACLLTDHELDTTSGVLEGNSRTEPPDALRARLTRMGTLLGTPAYMAPEQTKGLPVDHRADIWSFCAALYEALYCELPFPGRTSREVLHHVELCSVRHAPIGSSVPRWLRNALLRGLKANPAARYATMDALLDALSPPRGPRSVGVRQLAVIGAATAIASFGVLYAAWHGQLRGQHSTGVPSQASLVGPDSASLASPSPRPPPLTLQASSERAADRDTLAAPSANDDVHVELVPTSASAKSPQTAAPVSAKLGMPGAGTMLNRTELRRKTAAPATDSSRGSDERSERKPEQPQALDPPSATSRRGVPIIHD